MDHIDVLDKGYIALVDRMGTDATVVKAARSSFRKQNEIRKIEDDHKLIHYLAKHGHVSPFYHPHLMFQVKAPISVQRQWFKHKIGTAENSESTRYVEVEEEYYLPKHLRRQSLSSKQGSGDNLDPETNREGLEDIREAVWTAFNRYRQLIDLGVAKEQAREVLPLCTYTTWVWTASLAAVAHFLKLRDEAHAQYEIRQYAVAMRTLAEQHFPVSLNALKGTTNA